VLRQLRTHERNESQRGARPGQGCSPREGTRVPQAPSLGRPLEQFRNESTGRGIAPPGQEMRDQEKPRRRGGCSNTADLMLMLNDYPVGGIKELSRLLLMPQPPLLARRGESAPCAFIQYGAGLILTSRSRMIPKSHTKKAAYLSSRLKTAYNAAPADIQNA